MGESTLASAGLPITFCRGHDAILHGILQFFEPRSDSSPRKLKRILISSIKSDLVVVRALKKTKRPAVERVKQLEAANPDCSIKTTGRSETSSGTKKIQRECLVANDKDVDVYYLLTCMSCTPVLRSYCSIGCHEQVQRYVRLRAGTLGGRCLSAATGRPLCVK